ncbi:MAG: tetratricopeptide repeat protein [Xanthomonadaceae bacterium]|nr:tetratricopeptide repeat protein [Xanthomonadaceae bacterium]
MIWRISGVLSVSLLLAACAAGPRVPAADTLSSEQQFSTPEAELNYRLLLGEIALSRNELGAAADEYLRATQLSDDPGIAERAVQLSLHLERTTDAAAAAQRWRELEPGATGPLEVEVVIALRNGDQALAQRRVAALLDAWGGPSAEAFQSLGRILVDEPDRKAAATVMQRVAAQHDHPAAWQVLGLLALRAQETAVARHAAQRARVLEPESTQAAVLEARVLALTGESERGLALMRATVAEHPNDPTLRFALAGLYLAAEQNTEALFELEQVVATVPAYTDARWALAVLLMQMGELDAAEPHFEALLADPMRRWDIPYYLGGIHEQRGDLRAALEWFDQVEWGDNLLNARIKAAHMLMQLGQTDDARARLEHLHRDFPDERARLFRIEAGWLARAGDEAGALAIYNHALDMLPGDIEVLYARALHHERSGRVDAAIADLRRVNALQPGSAEAQNALGYVLADRGPPQSWEEARALIAQALTQEPDNAAFLDSMGWVLYRLGDLENARVWLERAWSLQPDAEIGAHLGEVLWRQELREAAHAVWERAAGLQPDHPVLVETLDRLVR